MKSALNAVSQLLHLGTWHVTEYASCLADSVKIDHSNGGAAVMGKWRTCNGGRWFEKPIRTCHLAATTATSMQTIAASKFGSGGLAGSVEVQIRTRRTQPCMNWRDLETAGNAPTSPCTCASLTGNGSLSSSLTTDLLCIAVQDTS
jgi:hypothetical protein